MFVYFLTIIGQLMVPSELRHTTTRAIGIFIIRIIRIDAVNIILISTTSYYGASHALITVCNGCALCRAVQFYIYNE